MNLKAAADATDASESTVKTRRRGAALEGALLEAAWAELLRCGYSAFTIEGVALQARTSRPVIARRWPSRGDLALAAVRHHIASHPLTIPDESDIRTELIAYIVELYERDFPIVLMMWTQMDEYYREENSSPARFRETLLAGQASAVGFLLERAAKRGEVDAGKLTDMVISIPGAFLSYITATRASQDIGAAVAEMIDSILLPLVVAKAPQERRFRT
ncbi:TetR family transcriptional regulator [Rhizorhabdus wittichii DC-6]|nr:TetR family transcriptional regulator [Rhizorhabdus wittichii DC-6]